MTEERRPVLRVPKEKGQRALERVKSNDNLDPSRRIREEENDILIPVKEGGNDWRSDLESREKRSEKNPYEKVKERLEHLDEKKEKLPDRWEMIGEVLLIELPQELLKEKERIGEAYAEVLGAKTVLLQGDIKGERREPEVEKIYGDETETIHVENEVMYKIDTSKLMFSSGNIDERIRMAHLGKEGETVVDMFAGIGYFTLPISVHNDPKKVYSLEINPTAYDYLKENIGLNGVEDKVEAWHGDNRDFSFTGADRVIMGYLHDTWKFLDKAVEFLDGTGMIHYHTTCKDSDLPRDVKRELEENIQRDFEILKIKNIKSYAPHVFHVVADVKVDG
ncbi:MAG: class I SAM-dependent methyltransferase family protein [Candidatus Thermoplasmatota archaeon]|nr:class I SAM-dependent methyltransferase family protein [Candidatus Thermoplasmatota archaeon]